MAEAKVFQLHLNGKNMSGRGVRYRMLSDREVDRNEAEAARGAREGSVNGEIWSATKRLGLEQMVVAMTEPGQKDLGGAVWRKTTPQELSEGWSGFFNAKDTAVLVEAYESKHEASKAELDAVMGKEVEVLAD
jgi:hypothetical protein